MESILANVWIAQKAYYGELKIIWKIKGVEYLRQRT